MKLGLIVWLSSMAWAAPPVVTKVDPPNWWAGHSINPVRLLIRGQGLGAASVESVFRTGAFSVNERGTYALVDLHIPRNAQPGRVPLKLTTPGGSVDVPFEISIPLSRAGRFQGFGPDDVIYLIMPDRFVDGDPSNNGAVFDRSNPRYYHGGDFKGIANQLPYLKDLGITTIWLTPVYENANQPNGEYADYHGYHAIDFYNVDEHLGTLEDFRKLVDAAHQAGMKVIQDQVANHTGPFHPWVDDPPKPTWFHGTREKHLSNPMRHWTLIDPHSPRSLREDTLDGWFFNILPDLNQEDPDVARYVIQNAVWWIGMSGIDGIRQDTLPYVPIEFWPKWTAAIKREYPQFRVLGELFDPDPGLVSIFEHKAGLDSLFDFPLYHLIRRAFASGGPLTELAAVLARDGLYRSPDRLVTFQGLHDVERFMNEPGASVAGLERSFTFLLTSRGIPMIYYGDEIAMPGGKDPDNRRDFPLGPRTAEQDAVFRKVRELARMRSANSCLRNGRQENVLVTDQVFAYRRTDASCSALVILNNGAEEARIEGQVVPARSSSVVITSMGAKRP